MITATYISNISTILDILAFVNCCCFPNNLQKKSNENVRLERVNILILNRNYLLNFDTRINNVIGQTFPKLTNWHPDMNENMYLSILIQSIKLMRWNIANP